MKYVALLTLILLAACAPIAEEGNTVTSTNPIVVLETNKGNIEIGLDREAAPQTVANFLSYVEDGYYDGLVFHRVIPGFMIQGGGFDQSNVQKQTRAAIPLEANLPNNRATVAMARTNNPNSATSQFFINLEDNNFLNPAPGNPGYAVFGQVIGGIETVDQIAQVATGTQVATTNTGQEGPFQDWPQEPIIIERAYIQ